MSFVSMKKILSTMMALRQVLSAKLLRTKRLNLPEKKNVSDSLLNKLHTFVKDT